MERSQKLLKDMHKIYVNAKKECNYNAPRYLEMISNTNDPVHTAKQPTLSHNPSAGFSMLWEMGRLDFTVEALIYNSPEYREFFSEEELKILEVKLSYYGYFESGRV